MSVSLEKLLSDAKKAGDTELVKILGQLETVCFKMDQLAGIGACPAGITNELRMMSSYNRTRIQSINSIRERI